MRELLDAVDPPALFLVVGGVLGALAGVLATLLVQAVRRARATKPRYMLVHSRRFDT